MSCSLAVQRGVFSRSFDTSLSVDLRLVARNTVQFHITLVVYVLAHGIGAVHVCHPKVTHIFSVRRYAAVFTSYIRWLPAESYHARAGVILMSDLSSRLGSVAYRVLLQAADSPDSSDGPKAEAPMPDDDLIEPHRGKGSAALDVFLCLLPILFLVLATVVRYIQMSTSTSLPLAAALLWVIRLSYLELDPNYTNAAVVFGLLDALKPLSIVTGAICLFQAMEATKVC